MYVIWTNVHLGYMLGWIRGWRSHEVAKHT